MNQLNFITMLAFRVSMVFTLLATLSSCAKDIYNPFMGKAESITVFSDGYLLTMSIAPDSSSIFALSGSPDKPQGHGSKVNLEVKSDDFETLKYNLRLLEISAVQEDEIVDRLVEDDTMGFDCSLRSSHNKSLFVTWRYKRGIERHALYYLGCHNSTSENSDHRISNNLIA